MRNPIIQLLLLSILLSHLGACQQVTDFQTPVIAGNAQTDETDFFRKELVTSLDNYENVEMVSVSFGYDLQAGQSISFVPPGYPEDSSVANRYLCTISVPSNSINDPNLMEVEISLFVQAFDVATSDPNASNPTTSFGLYTTHDAGLNFNEPIQVTICSHPSATDSELSTLRAMLYADQKIIDGQEVLVYRDLQYVSIDAETMSFTVSITYVPSFNSLGAKDGEGNWIEDPDDGLG